MEQNDFDEAHEFLARADWPAGKRAAERGNRAACQRGSCMQRHRFPPSEPDALPLVDPAPRASRERGGRALHAGPRSIRADVAFLRETTPAFQRCKKNRKKRRSYDRDRAEPSKGGRKRRKEISKGGADVTAAKARGRDVTAPKKMSDDGGPAAETGSGAPARATRLSQRRSTQVRAARPLLRRRRRDRLRPAPGLGAARAPAAARAAARRAAGRGRRRRPRAGPRAKKLPASSFEQTWRRVAVAPRRRVAAVKTRRPRGDASPRRRSPPAETRRRRGD